MRFAADFRAAGVLALLATGSFFLAFQGPGDIFLDFGPNDGRYVEGFREDFEIDEPTLFHWSTDRAQVRLPFHVQAPYEVTLRFKRHIEKPAEIRLFIEGDAVGSFTAPRQDFTLRTFRVKEPSGEAFELGLLSSSEDQRRLGLAIDWMRVRTERGRFLRTLPTVSAALALLSWVAMFYLLPRCLGLDRRIAFACGALALSLLIGAALAHKLWPLHAATTLGVRGHAVILLLALFVRFRERSSSSVFTPPLARYAVLVAAFGMAIRLFALFHPDFYYPDVRTHSKFVSLIWTEGLRGFLENHIENQHRHLLGLQYVSGRWVAFPYPPILYLTVYPLSLIQLPVEDWMKLVPTALLAVEALALFALVRKLGVDPRAALLAVALHASARVLAFRLAVASYAALYGHFWDTLAVLYLVFFFDRLRNPLVGAGLGALVSISILSYAGSVLVLGLFVPLLCLALLWVREERPSSVKAGQIGSLALWPLAGALFAGATFYVQYIPELLRSQPGPAARGGSGFGDLIDLQLTPLAALSMAFHRLRLFYGLVFTSLSIGALAWFLRKRAPGRNRLALPLSIAAAGTYAGMNFLRSGLGATHIFQFSKDDLVALPLIVALLAASFLRMWEGG
ncbi:MAG: hypothetical protein ACRD21_12275, partial [Vicinamibacteria bacterium]